MVSVPFLTRIRIKKGLSHPGKHSMANSQKRVPMSVSTGLQSPLKTAQVFWFL